MLRAVYLFLQDDDCRRRAGAWLSVSPRSPHARAARPSHRRLGAGRVSARRAYATGEAGRVACVLRARAHGAQDKLRAPRSDCGNARRSRSVRSVAEHGPGVMRSVDFACSGAVRDRVLARKASLRRSPRAAPCTPPTATISPRADGARIRLRALNAWTTQERRAPRRTVRLVAVAEGDRANRRAAEHRGVGGHGTATSRRRPPSGLHRHRGTPRVQRRLRGASVMASVLRQLRLEAHPGARSLSCFARVPTVALAATLWPRSRPCPRAPAYAKRRGSKSSTRSEFSQ